MQGHIINVAAQTIVDRELMYQRRLMRLAKMLLLVTNVVFGTGYYPGTLDSLDCLSDHHA